MDTKAVAIFVSSGVVLGLFVKPRVVAYLGIALFAAAILGMVVSAAIGQENWIFLFGVGAMGAPFIAGMAVIGSIGGAGIRRIFRRGKSEPQSGKHHDS